VGSPESLIGAAACSTSPTTCSFGSAEQVKPLAAQSSGSAVRSAASEEPSTAPAEHRGGPKDGSTAAMTCSAAVAERSAATNRRSAVLLTWTFYGRDRRSVQGSDARLGVGFFDNR
jgi:hypothetical protein